MSIYHDEIEIEDFEFDDEEEMYYYPCPCGDRFEISKVSAFRSIYLPNFCQTKNDFRAEFAQFFKYKNPVDRIFVFFFSSFFCRRNC